MHTQTQRGETCIPTPVNDEVALPRDSPEVSDKERWPCQETHRKSATKRDLLSLVGLLCQVATVVMPGWVFLRNLRNAAATVQRLYHWVHLNYAAQADLAWWHTFLCRWNGRSLIPAPDPLRAMVLDASGSSGCEYSTGTPDSTYSGRKSGTQPPLLQSNSV